MSSANIKDINSASKLIGSESNCEPGRLNPSSYACGIAQALPCTKLYPHATKAWIDKNKFMSNGNMYIPNSNGIKELKWMNSYVISRYSSWSQAYNHWLARVPIDGEDVGNWY